MFKFRVGDEVQIAGQKEIATIEQIVDEVALVKYPDGKKMKTALAALLPPLTNEIVLTPDKYDEAVKALMFQVAEDVGDTDQLDSVLEIVGVVCRRLKTRLFEGND